MFLEKTKGPHRSGWIEVICGSMFSGKTEELIRRLRRAMIARQTVEIFKPRIDVRYDPESIVSHDATSIRSTTVENASQILFYAGEHEVVGIDEAQFFDNALPQVCNQLADAGKRVIVAGLDMDYLGKPFGSMPQLMAIADYVTKLHAICMECGDLANFSWRNSDDSTLIQLGEKDIYEPLCRKHFIERMQKSGRKRT